MDASKFFSISRHRIPLDLPDLGRVYAREMTAAESLKYNRANAIRNAYVAMDSVQKERVDIEREPDTADIIIWCIVDENDSPIFNSAHKESIRNLPMSLHEKLLSAIFDASTDSPFSGQLPGNMDEESPLAT